MKISGLHRRWRKDADDKDDDGPTDIP